MRTAVVVFPGSNCDRDLAVAFARATGRPPAMLWHKDTELPPGLDLIGLPGGFSFGDYLRCGAIAAHAPICRAVADFARAGGHVLGVCNDFQVLTETGLLPGALIRNANLRFVCRPVGLRVETATSAFTQGYARGQAITLPIAHHDGNYVADPATIDRLRDTDRIAFTYLDNPNGSAGNIAGILSENRRVLGMMPHPERAADPALGPGDGTPLFAGLATALANA